MGFDDYNFNNDGEQGLIADFTDELTRKNFTKKVLALVGIMLTMCFGLVMVVKALSTGDDALIRAGYGLYSTPALIFSTVMYISMLLLAICCCRGLLRKVPINFIFLFLWTMFLSHIISFLGLLYDMDTVVSAMGATALITLTVSLLVAFTNFDFSKLLPIMAIVLLGWIFVNLIALIIGWRWDSVLKGVIGATIFTIYLAIDLKMMVGGGRFQYSEDEYVLAAINIFMDIINIFTYMLRIFSGNRN